MLWIKRQGGNFCRCLEGHDGRIERGKSALGSTPEVMTVSSS